jgi:hypothetical protein
MPYTFALTADGGVPPYQWSSSSACHAALTLSADGIVSGTVAAKNGDYDVQRAMVEDSWACRSRRTSKSRYRVILISMAATVISQRLVRFQLEGCACSSGRQLLRSHVMTICTPCRCLLVIHPSLLSGLIRPHLACDRFELWCRWGNSIDCGMEHGWHLYVHCHSDPWQYRHQAPGEDHCQLIVRPPILTAEGPKIPLLS